MEEDPSIVFQLSLSDSPGRGALEFIPAFIGCDPKQAIESKLQTEFKSSFKVSRDIIRTFLAICSSHWM